MTDDLASEIETNVSAFLLSMGTAGGGTTRADQEITWTVGGSPIGYHNAVTGCDVDESRGRSLVADWLHELKSRELPGSWHLAPTMKPRNLADLLLEAGFEDGGEEPAMAMLLADLSERPPPTELTFHTVSDTEQLDGYRRVLAAGFGEGPKEADWVTAVFSAIGLHGEEGWRHFVATEGDEPVATASLLLAGGTAGIYFVCTHPNHRRRGLGEAVTHHALTFAADHGAQVAVLGSSPMGQRIYERLGFQTAFSYRLLEWEP